MAKSKAASSGHDSPTPQRGRPREFDRNEAVNKAMEVFWKNGYMQTTMGELCRAMGITAPSFYCAFGTREELFLETVDHYVGRYWNSVLERFMAEKDIHAALKNFLLDAVKVYLRPNLPRGCFLDISTAGLPQGESRIINVLSSAEKRTEELFRKRLMLAIDAGQIPPDSDIPAISGALIAFLKGISVIARKDLCLAELMEIASRGLMLLPPRHAD